MGACGSKSGVSDTSKKGGNKHKEWVSAFKSADELVDFSTFFPEGCKSEL